MKYIKKELHPIWAQLPGDRQIMILSRETAINFKTACFIFALSEHKIKVQQHQDWGKPIPWEFKYDVKKLIYTIDGVDIQLYDTEQAELLNTQNKGK